MTTLTGPTTHSIDNLAQLARNVIRASSLDQIIELQTQAEAFATWVRTKEEGTKLSAAANRIVLQAERRLGELSRSLPKKSSRWGKHPTKKGVLEAVGVYPKRARDAEKLAAVPAPEFNKFLEEAERPTVGSALKAFGLRKDYAYPSAVGAWRSIAYDAVAALEAWVNGEAATRSKVMELRRRCREAVGAEGSMKVAQR